MSQDSGAPLETNVGDLTRGLKRLTGEYRSFVESTIGVIDSLERWKEQANGAEAERVDLIYRQACGLLILHGIRPTARVGETLDLRYHEVIAVEADDTRPPDTILRVIRMGFEMSVPSQGLVSIRPSQVVVSRSIELEARTISG